MNTDMLQELLSDFSGSLGAQMLLDMGKFDFMEATTYSICSMVYEMFLAETSEDMLSNALGPEDIELISKLIVLPSMMWAKNNYAPMGAKDRFKSFKNLFIESALSGELSKQVERFVYPEEAQLKNGKKLSQSIANMKNATKASV